MTNQSRFTDPDPYQLASLAIEAASLGLSLVAIFMERGRKEHAPLNENQVTVLQQVDQQTSKALGQFKDTQRFIERNASDPDRSFYGAPVRVATTSMLMSGAAVVNYGRELSQLHLAVGSLSQWIYHLIGQDPDLASRLGARLTTPLSDLAAQLNSILENGEPVHRALEECRTSLLALEKALQEEFGANGRHN